MPFQSGNPLSPLWVSSASGGKETKAIEWEEEQQVRTFPSLTCSSWFGGAGAGGRKEEADDRKAGKQASSRKLLGGGIGIGYTRRAWKVRNRNSQTKPVHNNHIRGSMAFSVLREATL